jgi:hypothetical protein
VPDGVTAELRAALDSAPDDERALLEVRLAWTGLDEAAERIAARLRVCIVTWGPLKWHEPRPARATATGDGLEVVLYVALDELLPHPGKSRKDLADVLAGIYPQFAVNGNAPGLLSEVGGTRVAERPAVALVSAG